MMKFICPLFDFDATSGKLLGIKKIIMAGLPAPQIYVLNHSAFLEHSKTGFSGELKKELETVFAELTKSGGVVTVRSAFSENDLSIMVKSQTNLPTLGHMLSAIETVWDEAKKLGAGPEADLKIILQRFFESEKMGHLHTSFGTHESLIEALPGQVVYSMTREGVKPDTYIVDREGKIRSKSITVKETKMVKADVGLKKVRTDVDASISDTLSSDEVKRIAEYGRKMVKKYGPQEMEFAITPEGELIFFDSRDSEMSSSKNGFCVSSGSARGKLLRINSMVDLPQVTSKNIVVLKHPSIDLVTFLSLKHKPAGVVLVGSSPSSHSATILREAKIPSISIEDVFFQDGEMVDLNADLGVLAPL